MILALPLPSPLSEDLKERISKWYYEDQDTIAEIAAQARCSKCAAGFLLTEMRTGHSLHMFRVV
jgi:hypothetical protein